MPLTKLDTTAALVVIDLQKGVVGLPTVHITGERRPAAPAATAPSARQRRAWSSTQVRGRGTRRGWSRPVPFERGRGDPRSRLTMCGVP
jgi:hypothetical protein